MVSYLSRVVASGVLFGRDKPALILLLSSIQLVAAKKTFVIPDYEYATPIFGLAVGPHGSLLVADAGEGIVELRNGKSKLIAELAFVTDIAPKGGSKMFAITGLGGDPIEPPL